MKTGKTNAVKVARNMEKGIATDYARNYEKISRNEVEKMQGK